MASSRHSWMTAGSTGLLRSRRLLTVRVVVSRLSTVARSIAYLLLAVRDVVSDREEPPADHAQVFEARVEDADDLAVLRTRAHRMRVGSAPRGHSITWSARWRSDGGIVRPSAFAVLRLIASSNFVGRSPGRSAGLAPFKIL